MKTILLFVAMSISHAAGPPVVESSFSKHDFALTLDPKDPNWRGKAIFAGNDRDGKPEPAYRMEVRTRWTEQNLYFLFICPYQELHLKPGPSSTTETNQLWNWDVAEVFIGSDFERTRQYKEFEVSPQGEWVDLDIDLDHPKPENGWKWDSGFESKARIDPARKIWYAAMRIPRTSVDPRPARNGLAMRVNFFRCQGKEPGRKYIAWQTPHNQSFHRPEVFGILKLTGK